MSNGRLYPLLGRLEADGLVIREPDGGGHAPHVYRLADPGRERLRHLMRDTALSQGDDRRLFWIKVAFFDLIEPDERSALLEHDLGHCRAHLAHLLAEAGDIAGRLTLPGFMQEPQRAAILFTLRHAVAQWCLELEQVELWRREHGADGAAPPASSGGLAPPPGPRAPRRRRRT